MQTKIKIVGKGRRLVRLDEVEGPAFVRWVNEPNGILFVPGPASRRRHMPNGPAAFDVLADEHLAEGDNTVEVLPAIELVLR